jgi:hypothetical protein
VQFVIVVIHSSLPMIYECDYPIIVNYLQVIFPLYFMYLFGLFYRKTYRSKKDI